MTQEQEALIVVTVLSYQWISGAEDKDTALIAHSYFFHLLALIREFEAWKPLRRMVYDTAEGEGHNDDWEMVSPAQSLEKTPMGGSVEL